MNGVYQFTFYWYNYISQCLFTVLITEGNKTHPEITDLLTLGNYFCGCGKEGWREG